MLDAERGQCSEPKHSGEQVRSAEKKLAAFGDVDGAILKHRAASFKSAAQGGPTPTLGACLRSLCSIGDESDSRWVDEQVFSALED
jgi:hypothetical protein